ncbi:MAG: hypothetical protein GY882_03925 [Actinomycetia bacterium]|nr:hypothetical protein [Actinomycetes bacterium]MCP4843678.1 hypothetical protein [Actinomycetes bacterium]
MDIPTAYTTPAHTTPAHLVAQADQLAAAQRDGFGFEALVVGYIEPDPSTELCAEEQALDAEAK